MTVMDHEDFAVPDDRTDIEACMTCLSDDAALLHSKNPEDEVADNMLKAEAYMRDMHDAIRWAYGKLHHAHYSRQDDALMLDRMKLLLEYGA